MTTTTYQYRIKDSSIRDVLIPMSSAVNYIWNFCNDIVRRRWQESRFYTSESTLHELTKGASKLFNLNSQTIQAIYEELLKQVKKRKRVRFRSAKWKRKWIPFKGQTFKFCGNYSTYNGYKIRYWYHRPLPAGAVVKTGSICEDAEGKWFLNLVVSFPEYLFPAPDLGVGIDLGIKTTLATSDGQLLERPNFFTASEAALAKAQRHRKKRKVRKLHTKIRNQRKDWNHKRTFELAESYRHIFVGDATSTSILTEINNINKAVYDASWYMLKTLLSYKVSRRQGVYLEVSESQIASTETCSSCLGKTGPSGVTSLRIREWVCCACGAKHHRDINAAVNHLRFGHETLRAAKAA